MVEHTKLPWKLEADQHFGPGFVITSVEGGMQNRCPVVRMQSPLGEDDETLRGDAELIVTAVNSYHATTARIAALEGALETEREESASYHRFWIEQRDKAMKLEKALEHVTELLVGTWATAMQCDPEREVAVVHARATLRAALASTEAMKGEIPNG